ncbi:MAG TPA: transglutaminase family protein [Acidimicrobiales bacterium]|nr:transglutaminase family protein [Acidimicrobiales bacterium]
MSHRLVLQQTLRYDYPSPVHRLDHHLMVLPPARHGDQVRTESTLEVRGAGADVTESVDAFGNVAVLVRAAEVQAWVEFVVRVTVERHDGAGAEAPAADRHRMLAKSALTEPDGALRRAARRLCESGDSGLGLAQRVNAWVAAHMWYCHDVTTVRTTAAEALAVGAGVCQDYAHVMLALCRLSGLPARYVSGHMVGEGGSHAWVEVLLPSATARSSLVAVPFDPTNNRMAGAGYLTVAVGRDYADVAPTHGSYCGSAGGSLTTTKSLEQEAVDLVAC